MKRLKRIWYGMKSRCNNKNSHSARHYYYKGIKVCEEWLDFPAFEKWAIENGYRENLTIDRIDPDADYKPSNCRWITRSENSKRICRVNNSETFKKNGLKPSYRVIEKTIYKREIVGEFYYKSDALVFARYKKQESIKRCASRCKGERDRERVLKTKYSPEKYEVEKM